MNTTRVVTIVLIAVAILILAYAALLYRGSEMSETTSPQEPKTTPSGEASPTPTKTSLPSDTRTSVSPTYDIGFFNYRWLKYKINTEGGEFTYTYENLGEDFVDGRACYRLKISMEEKQEAEIDIWYDKSAGECVRAMVSVPGTGSMEVPCSQQLGAVPSVEERGMVYVGEEVVSVPAGTFECYVFEGEGVRSWVAKEGLLVKWVSQEGEGVLLGYRR
ncbi:MAG: hypothetical protein NZ992_04415 [Candidatus Korarchaeum sp.]|nr:hypothetical protein [Candidatus Korarchaeum sp.]MDW8035060.1 hypothetical protein [Candidatus Korarchaeum sp.]